MHEPAMPRVFRRSSYCGNSTCVEVATANSVHVRDGKNPDGAVLCFEAGPWREFLHGVKRGEMDRG
ncbi:DUF397 domain-containing protein [Dactylosporangium matsuzakiense]|nr:DUF397 domain-containing protein [Dactylosporangium matsuzakiense]